MRDRVWFYKPGSWLRWQPLSQGVDEYGRRTIVIGNWLTGCIVVAYGPPSKGDDNA